VSPAAAATAAAAAAAAAAAVTASSCPLVPSLLLSLVSPACSAVLLHALQL
jgi:hypothetical protein